MTMLLYRQMMVIGCEPGAVGAMSTGSSPLDPIFWVLHPAFEKASHILGLAENYQNTYDMEWVSADCGNKSGGKLDDTFPFSGVHEVGVGGWGGGGNSNIPKTRYLLTPHEMPIALLHGPKSQPLFLPNEIPISTLPFFSGSASA